MALSFFHGGQLVRGAEAGEQEQPTGSLGLLPEDDTSNTLRLRPHAVRRLHSETTLRERAKADESPQKSRPSSRINATAPKGDKVKDSIHPVSGFSKPSRPVTSHSAYTEADSVATAEPSKARSMRVLGMKKPNFLSMGSPSVEKMPELPRPKSSGTEGKSWKEKEAFRRQDAPPRTPKTPQRPKTATQESGTPRPNAFQRISNAAAKRKATIATPHFAAIPTSQPIVPRKDPVDPATYLAESLAHVIVGEWLYKDPHKPGLMPQTNVLQRHVGPPPRGTTGVPQKRWFRIDPFDRNLSWSSKWDSAASAQHKIGRKVPIKLVFEVSNQLLLDGCIPPHALPHDRSIVIVAPSKVLKLTAPDEIRHDLWFTALQYLVDSTRKVAAHAWPDVLAARLSSLNPLLGKGGQGHTSTATQRVAQIPKSIFNSQKPLPPSPPRLPTMSTIMTPPAVPRFSHHAAKPSEGAATTAESEGSMPGPAPSSSKSAQSVKSVKSERAELYTSSSERQAPQSPAKTHETKQYHLNEQTDTGEDDLEVDQMDQLVSRLAEI